MSATSKTFQVTPTATGASALDISSIDIIYVVESGSGAQITMNTNGAANSVFAVTETPAAISVAAQYLIAVTENATGVTLYINVDRIVDVVTARSTEADIIYNDNGATNRTVSVDESRSAIRTAIEAIVGSGGGSVVTGITAFAGGGQANATQLSYGYNEVTVVATAGDSVKLPAAINGGRVEVINEGANSMDVFPATGDTINDGAANAAIPVPPGVTVVFVGIDATNWEANDQGILFTTNITGTKEANHSVLVAATTTAATAGGNLSVVAGAGATSGAGGVAALTGGLGGGTGAGGNVTVTTGAGGGTSGDSGDLTLATAAETGADGTGDAVLRSGEAESANSGAVGLFTGDVTTSGNSGVLTVSSGDSDVAGNSGNLVIATGAAATGNSGDVSISTATPSVDGKAGDVNIVAGASIGNNNGGAVSINAGNADTGSGQGGTMTLFAGDGTADGVNGTDGGQVSIDSGFGGNATTGAGGNAGAVVIAGQNGGAASGAAGSGGTGGAVNIQAGKGGACTDGAGGAETGGLGANVQLTAGAGGNLDAASIGTAGNGGSLVMTPGVGGTAAGGTAGVEGIVVSKGLFAKRQAAPAAKTTSDTLTVAQILAGLITVNQGGGANSDQTTPTGTQLEAALPTNFAIDDSFDFHLINISAVAAETATLVAGVDVSIVGDAIVPAITAAGAAPSSATFRFRKSGANTFVVYRIG